MIDPSTIEDIDDCDGERVHAYGRATTGRWGWQWVPVETLYEAGRGDILRAVGLLDDEAA